MFIECETCRSIYEMEPARLKPEGSKVRCSVCGHVFFVKPEPEIHLQKGVDEDTVGEEARAKPDAGPEALHDLSELLKELEISNSSAQAAKADKTKRDDFSTRKPQETPLKMQAREQLKPYKFEERKKKTSYLRVLLLLFVLFLVGAAGSVLVFAPELIPWKIPFVTKTEVNEADPGAKWLSLTEVKGGFVESAASGRLFVIRGFVRNNDKAPRGMILLKASLLDQKGNPVRSIHIYAGNSREDSQLSEMDIAAIKAAMGNKSGAGNSNLRVEPGASIPFMAVFDNLPENLSEFIVEPVASSKVGN